jgi:polysaccharide export outer membrane protein
MRSIFVVLLLAQTPGQPPTTPPVPVTQNLVGAPADYVVGPGDQLSISVVGVDVFTGRATVDIDGAFQYLDIARLKAAGLTLTQIAKEIHDTLVDKHLFNDPTVNADIAVYRSQTIYIEGAVRNPMSYPINGNTSLMMALASAGFTASSGQKITVTRRPPGTPIGQKPQVFNFDRKDLEEGRIQNFRLQDGDMINVAEVEKCFVAGEVRTPGPYDVTSDHLTVNQVLAMAGGVTDRGSKSRVTIQRTVDGKVTTIKVKKDLSDIVLPGDTINVPRRIL